VLFTDSSEHHWISASRSFDAQTILCIMEGGFWSALTKVWTLRELTIYCRIIISIIIITISLLLLEIYRLEDRYSAVCRDKSWLVERRRKWRHTRSHVRRHRSQQDAVAVADHKASRWTPANRCWVGCDLPRGPASLWRSHFVDCIPPT